MDRTIKLLVTELLHQANDMDCNLVIKRVENEGYIINDEKKTRVVAVGLLNIKDEDKEEAVIGAFTIDIKRYKWADAEGFTLDQMIDEEALSGEIFNLIGVDEVLSYLCHNK